MCTWYRRATVFLKEKDGTNQHFVAKFVTEFSIFGLYSAIDKFIKSLRQRFENEFISTPEKLKFLRCDVSKTDCANTMRMPENFQRVKLIDPTSSQTANVDKKTYRYLTSIYQSLAEPVLFFGQAAIPQASLVASTIQQSFVV